MNTSVNQCMSLHYYTPDLHKLSKVVEILEYLDNALAVYILRFVYEFDQSEQLFFFISLFSSFRATMHNHIVNTLKLHFFNGLLYIGCTRLAHQFRFVHTTMYYRKGWIKQ